MALTMYLTIAPRYKNTTVKEIQLIGSYFNWLHEKEIGSKYAVDTFEKWCGHSEIELPNKDILDYYKTFWNSGNLFKQAARIVKANQIFNWFIKNVMNETIDSDYHEVNKEQIECLLNKCKKIIDSLVFVEKNKYNEDEYTVDEGVAKELLPLMENRGYFFGPIEYNNLYANQIIAIANILENILTTTDFKQQTIYFNATW